MTYPPHGNWPDQSWPSQQPPQYPGPTSGVPGYDPAYPAYGYGTPTPMATARPMNGLAIASLILALVGFLTCGLTSLVGAILGHVARRQIQERGEDGAGMALAGIITGWIVFALHVFIIVGYFAFAFLTIWSSTD